MFPQYICPDNGFLCKIVGKDKYLKDSGVVFYDVSNEMRKRMPTLVYFLN
jgi:hypothetical protein